MKLGLSREQKLRYQIAQEAARIMAVDHVRDFLLAKRKAAAHLGIGELRYLPTNREVEQALEEYQRLFRSDSQPAFLQQLRETAVAAMRFFSRFSPRLVGDVWTGVADEYSRVQLHLFADVPEEVALFLHDEGIPFEEAEQRVRFGRDTVDERPMFRFVADSTPVELVVFPVDGMRQAPCSPVDGRPMERASLAMVECLNPGDSLVNASET